MPYYNTNKLVAAEKEVATIQTEKQEDIVKGLFLKYKNLTPSDVYQKYPHKHTTPLTSIRRAITDLKNDGFLIKTDQRKPGMFGSPEHYYSVRTGQLKMF